MIEEEIEQLRQIRVEKIRKFFQLAHSLEVCNVYCHFTKIPKPKSDEVIFKEAKDMEDSKAKENLQPMTLEEKIDFWTKEADKLTVALAECHDVYSKIPHSQLRNRK
ncbi:unnamed protein product [Arabis nemorensis]|uniref:Uncharacterized protein n=1 Tax=Arabis nemorensis TaxID=586526 RepID=A0A565CHU1_9BRAS|nr:unnamed protein product [Arabis nemorensis]